VAPQPEIGLQPPLQRGDAKLLEPRRLGLRERLHRELGERGPAPQLQRGTEATGSLRGPTGLERRRRVRDQPLEPVEIELIRLEREHVSRRACVQRP
jgi:hypothetical protein